MLQNDSIIRVISPNLTYAGNSQKSCNSPLKRLSSLPFAEVGGNNVTDGTSHFEGNCYVGGGSVGIDDVETGQQIVNDSRVFTIDGRYLGTEVPANFRGVYIQNGKKHIKLQ